MNIEAQEAMIIAGSNDACFANLMAKILKTYERSLGSAGGASPRFAREMQAFENITFSIKIGRHTKR